MLIYLQEMYFRHLYASTQPTLVQRCDSYDNYCALFNVILVGNVNMQVTVALQLHNMSCLQGYTNHNLLFTLCCIHILLAMQSQTSQIL